jgi:hypothetical protein
MATVQKYLKDLLEEKDPKKSLKGKQRFEAIKLLAEERARVREARQGNSPRRETETQKYLEGVKESA